MSTPCKEKLFIIAKFVAPEYSIIKLRIEFTVEVRVVAVSTINTDEIRNEIKANIARSGWTLTNIVNEMNKSRPAEEQTTTQNISNKLSRGTIKYSEVLEIAKIIGYQIKWEPK